MFASVFLMSMFLAMDGYREAKHDRESSGSWLVSTTPITVPDRS
jgi:hypothetical protein